MTRLVLAPPPAFPRMTPARRAFEVQPRDCCREAGSMPASPQPSLVDPSLSEATPCRGAALPAAPPAPLQ